MAEEKVCLVSPMIEFIKRKNKKQEKPKGIPKDSIKAGVFVAGIDPVTSTVCIGFSLCHRQMDEFDVIKTQDKKVKVPGFGVNVAINRALKWQKHEQAIFSSTPTESIKYNYPQGTVIIPSSLQKDGKEFIQRCIRYYQNPKHPEMIKKLPEWVGVFLR